MDTSVIKIVCHMKSIYYHGDKIENYFNKKIIGLVKNY